ncbi:MAG TPA: deoxyribonuclease II family protein [Terracidiphilus sp.]|nr:deoxyribonuclease II family protein [Terracidiphilus sp.]
MPAKKKSTSPSDPPATRRGAAIRTLAPAVPLAIALAHSALTNQPATTTTANSSATATHQAAPPSAGIMTKLTACGGDGQAACAAPYPMLAKGHPVDWWFVFKLNVSKFPSCGGGTVQCAFGGSTQSYTPGLQYAYASSEVDTLQPGGKDCLGDGTNDPVGATFDQVYNGNFHYLIWNDQFYGDPGGSVSCGGQGCDAPWGHSKGMVAWNDAGEGMVMQVSTPSWPAAGSAAHARKDGNTLGCVTDDDVKVSQHFFSLRLSHDDLMMVLDGLANASVVTDPKNVQIVSNGGPSDVQAKVNALGVKSSNAQATEAVLSSGVELISKPSALHVAPWQMVSSLLGGVPLRTATWWASPTIPSTTGGAPECWDNSLKTPPGAVEIATSGTWNSTTFSLKGGISPDANHAKLGVSTSASDPFVIFGDENQQGALKGNCGSSQNGRGGTFYVMTEPNLAKSVTGLIAGDTAPQ